jgi:hypothetical protein
MRLWGVLDSGITDKDAALIRPPFTALGWLGVGEYEEDWTPETRAVSSWTPGAAQSSSWLATVLNLATWTPESAASSSWTPQDATTSSWTPEGYIPTNLIAHWKMNDNAASTTVADSEGSHNGTAQQNTNLISVAGKTTTALSFNGSSDYIIVTNHADFTPALEPFSISAWVYITNKSNFIIASKGVLAVDGEWLFYLGGDGNFSLICIDNEATLCYIGRLYSQVLTENTWTHLVGTYDGGTTSASIKLYVNGSRVDDLNNQNNEDNFTTVRDVAHDVWIGRYDTSYANGRIDNVMIFKNKELTATEVTSLYSWPSEGPPVTDWS